MAGGRKSGSISREKKLKRKEILEKKKAVDELIKRAYDENGSDPLAAFSAFRRYDRNGICVCLESGSGDKLTSHVKQYIQALLKLNMEKPYGSEWPTEEKIKRREMVAPEARYLFVLETQSVCDTPVLGKVEDEMGNVKNIAESKSSFVGFVHYRFTVEEDVPVLYVYELQLEPRVQGKGLGKFLMQLLELIAHKKHMSAVVLTVQRENMTAVKFYLSMRYNISLISPSKVGVEKNYEILCKAFDVEAKEKLECH